MTTTSDEFDLGEGAAQAAPEPLKRLNELADEAISLEQLIEDQETTLAAAKTALHEIRTKFMPELMMQIQMTQFVHGNRLFQMKDFVSGSLPKEPDKRTRALELLKEYQAEGLIKTDVTIAFGRSQYEQAIKFYDALAADGMAATLETSVHAQTLQSFARKRLEKGESIDTEALGLYVGKVVKTPSDKKKGNTSDGD